MPGGYGYSLALCTAKQDWQPPGRKSTRGEPDQLAYQEYCQQERHEPRALKPIHSTWQRLQPMGAASQGRAWGFGKAPRQAPEVNRPGNSLGKLPRQGGLKTPIYIEQTSYLTC